MSGAATNTARLRPAGPEDVALVFEWANDPEVRRNAFHPEAISWESHRVWYATKLVEAKTLMMILETGDGRPLGQIRFEEVPQGIEVDLSVAPSWRGQGLGRELVKQGLAAAAGRWPIGTTVIAKVLTSNVRSRRLFEGAGFLSQGVRMCRQTAYDQLERALAT